MFKAIWTKIKAFFKAIWAVICWIFRKVLSPILDRQWDLDPYKIGGYACFGIAGLLAVKLLPVIATMATDKLLSIAGLASAFLTAGTFMFGHAKGSDNTLSPPRAGQ